MFVRISKLRRVVAEQAAHLFEELKEDSDRIRRGVQDNWSGESHDRFEEEVELEDFEFEAKKKDEEEPEEEEESDDTGGDDDDGKPAFLKKKEAPKKKSPPKEEEEAPKKASPGSKQHKAKKGMEKAQKQKKMPKSQVDPATGVKQDIDLDALSQLATEAGYHLERNEPEEPDLSDDFGLGSDSGEQDFGLGLDPGEDDGKFPGDDDEMNFDDKSGPGKDIEDEDVALFSSDEDLSDVLGQEQPEEDDLSDLEGHPMSMKRSLPVAKQGQGSTKQGGVKLRIR